MVTMGAWEIAKPWNVQFSLWAPSGIRSRLHLPLGVIRWIRCRNLSTLILRE